MAMTARVSRNDTTPSVAGLATRVAALEAENTTLKAENTALASLGIALAVKLPGGPSSADRIITGELRLTQTHADAIITAAQRRG